MNKNQLMTTAVLAVLFAGAVAGFAAEPTLKVGSPAPKLQTGKWIQGDPVTAFESNKVYIVEFWATWCGPCKVSIPHLNEIYTKFKDRNLVVIGQDCWEQDEKQVAPFVKNMGDTMTYRVALDDKSGSEKGKMAESWMDAAGRDGIPSAFVVDQKGIIAWIGHPMELTESMIEEVLAGKFDVKKAAADYEMEHKNATQLREISTALGNAIQQKDWTGALGKLDEAAKLLPEGQRNGLEMTRFRILAMKGDYPAAYRVAQRISDENKNNVMLQNALAWTIATDGSIEKRDLDLAETIATRANDAGHGKNPDVLDTLARIQFMNNKKADAIANEEKAVQLADDDMKTDLRKTLESYKKGELPKDD